MIVQEVVSAFILGVLRQLLGYTVLQQHDDKLHTMIISEDHHPRAGGRDDGITNRDGPVSS